ncbi:glyoxylate/hydroxypyruvate reductase A [Paracoccus sp. TK19116]|uniref:Glyoxylate/hydroxypyruvate reductase A n=1 Tax=Paracoccus albicereus TaxID=2922394 RepID=A0ABT1MQU2_9RHOB|nr:glyoxylate/hydroxypyruvate reductase A [Paracoccus albicereus]MCQ0970084.1 glyoxylate/hydroxypyruvate reductase A [Paracoccus albicereus]
MSTGRAEMRVLFAAPDHLWDDWSSAMGQVAPEVTLVREGAPDSIDAILFAPGGEIEDLSPYVNARLVQSMWAGVERIVTNPTLTQPLARMVDPSLTQSMAEYCTGWTMRAHLGMDIYRQDGTWRNGTVPPLASDRPVTILGLGELGRAVGRMLSGIGFSVRGVSRAGRDAPGVEGIALDRLHDALASAQVLISLLPDTEGTRNLLNARALSLLPRGAWIINPGRGTVIDHEALIAALDDGHIGHAVLDVFRTEPLPEDHPFWSHPKVTVTPHIAAETRAETAAVIVAENLRRAMAGEPIHNLVDRQRGY